MFSLSFHICSLKMIVLGRSASFLSILCALSVMTSCPIFIIFFRKFFIFVSLSSQLSFAFSLILLSRRLFRRSRSSRARALLDMGCSYLGPGVYLVFLELND
eukprot:TCONS_00031532-protein